MIKKYTSTLMLAISLAATSFAQDDAAKSIASTTKEFKAAPDSIKKWDVGGSVALNFGQTYLQNWASGGQNALSIAFTGLVHANYRKNKWAWDNNLTVGLGGIAQFPQQKYSDKMNGYPFRKNIDNIQLTSTGGYQIDKEGKWFFSAGLDFRTQLLRGYGNYHYDSTANGGTDPVGKINARDKTSEFAAPAYLTLSTGITYKPFKKSWLTFYLAPVAGKFTFVNPGANIYNAKGGGIGATAYGLNNPTSVYRAEFGWYFRANLEKEVFKNVIIKSQLELFGNYLDKAHRDNLSKVTDPNGTVLYDPATASANRAIGVEQNSTGGYSTVYGYDNRKNVDVNWQTWITFKINKYLQASLEWQLIYDYDISVPKYMKDGITTYQGRGVQFREGFQLGLGYMF